MERLQAALQAAREQRGQRAATLNPSHNPPPKADQSNDQTARWERLERFELSETTLRAHRIVTQKANARATAFDILRTKILLQMRQNGWTRLAITSPMPASGKTTTACNLALGVGRQKDLRAILIDLDLRQPSIHRFFDFRSEMSVSDVLAGRTTFAEQARRVGDNVAVAMSGAPNPDPTQLLLANDTADRLDEIEKDYGPNIMIFDMPSVLSGDDTRAFLKNVDCALIVVRANATRYAQFDACEQEIGEHTNVLGVVLNATRYESKANA